MKEVTLDIEIFNSTCNFTVESGGESYPASPVVGSQELSATIPGVADFGVLYNPGNTGCVILGINYFENIEVTVVTHTDAALSINLYEAKAGEDFDNIPRLSWYCCFDINAISILCNRYPSNSVVQESVSATGDPEVKTIDLDASREGESEGGSDETPFVEESADVGTVEVTAINSDLLHMAGDYLA